jgi:hypothetical protein
VLAAAAHTRPPAGGNSIRPAFSRRHEDSPVRAFRTLLLSDETSHFVTDTAPEGERLLR